MSKANYWIATAILLFVSAGAFLTVREPFAPWLGGARRSIKNPVSGWTSEAILRKHAIKTVLPEYPASAIREHESGVAVAMVYLDLSGHVSKVQILRSPGPAIAESMSAALLQWIFRPLLAPDGEPAFVSGKITFYFEIHGNQGVILDPSSVGYVGKGA